MKNAIRLVLVVAAMMVMGGPGVVETDDTDGDGICAVETDDTGDGSVVETDETDDTAV